MRKIHIAVLGVLGMPCRMAAAAPAMGSTAPADDLAPASIASKPPEGWILFDDATVTPVVDDVSRHLDEARQALAAKDPNKAAAELRATAALLKQQGVFASAQGKVLVAADQELLAESKAVLATDESSAQLTAQQMAKGATAMSAAAAAVDSGKCTKAADLDQAIGIATRADLDRRWAVADVTTWYPVSDEPQHNFAAAATAYSAKDYPTASAELHKALSYLHLESARASGDSKRALAQSVAELERLAVAAEKGTVVDGHAMSKAFARAQTALALHHRSKTAESLAHREYNKAGYELRAAGQSLENAAYWAGAEEKAGAAASVADTRKLGDKLVAGTNWTRDEVAKGMASLAKSLDALGRMTASNDHSKGA